MTLPARRGGVLVAVAALLMSGAVAAQTGRYHGRRAWTLRNNHATLVITPGGGHIASFTLKSGPAANLNPFWLPPWRSKEPGAWRANPAAYGGAPAAALLSTILGHNICVDFFGSPSSAEAAAGMPPHGEAPTVDWRAVSRSQDRIRYAATLPKAQMRVTRTIRLGPGSGAAWITETVENLRPQDRPFGWQQHPTFGPPFLESGASFFDLPGGRSMVYPREFSKGERLKRGAEFTWPDAPAASGGTVDLRRFPTGGRNSDYTATLIDAGRQWGFLTAINTRRRLVAGYVWPRAQWPWVGNWEEQRFRAGLPWGGKAVARGMEFGATPFPDSLRDAVTLNKLFGVPTYRWISARAQQTVAYGLFIAEAPPGATGVKDVQVQGSSIRIILSGVDRTLTLPLRR